jgi:hypothetical protein
MPKFKRKLWRQGIKHVKIYNTVPVQKYHFVQDMQCNMVACQLACKLENNILSVMHVNQSAEKYIKQ